MAKLEEMGEFVRSASSTIEAPVVRKLKEALNSGSAKPDRGGGAASASGGRDQGGDQGGSVPTEARPGCPTAPRRPAAPRRRAERAARPPAAGQCAPARAPGLGRAPVRRVRFRPCRRHRARRSRSLPRRRPRPPGTAAPSPRRRADGASAAPRPAPAVPARGRPGQGGRARRPARARAHPRPRAPRAPAARRRRRAAGGAAQDAPRVLLPAPRVPAARRGPGGARPARPASWPAAGQQPVQLDRDRHGLGSGRPPRLRAYRPARAQRPARAGSARAHRPRPASGPPGGDRSRRSASR